MVEPLPHSPATASSPVNIGLIGYGYWGGKVHATLERNAHFALSRLHVRHPEKLSTSQQLTLANVEIHSAADAIWNDQSIEAVIIVSPIDSHYTLCRQALEANKHVLVEKPLCLRANEAIELASLAHSRGLTLQTDYTWTFSPGLQYAQQLVAEGWLGELRSVQVRFHQLGRFRQHGVGPLLIVHMLSIVQMFTPLNELDWQLIAAPTTGELVTTVTLLATGSSGVKIVLDASLDDPIKSQSVCVIGSMGALSFQPLAGGLTVTAQRYDRDATAASDGTIHSSKSITTNERDNLGHALDAFAEVLRKERPSNLESSVLITQLLESFMTRRPRPN